MTLDYLCTEYRENKRMIDELNAMNDVIKGQIIDAMNGCDVVISGSNKITYKEYTSARLDTKRLKDAHPDIYNEFATSTAYKRFTIS